MFLYESLENIHNCALTLQVVVMYLTLQAHQAYVLNGICDQCRPAHYLSLNISRGIWVALLLDHF